MARNKLHVCIGRMLTSPCLCGRCYIKKENVPSMRYNLSLSMFQACGRGRRKDVYSFVHQFACDYEYRHPGSLSFRPFRKTNMCIVYAWPIGYKNAFPGTWAELELFTGIMSRFGFEKKRTERSSAMARTHVHVKRQTAPQNQRH